MDSFDCVLALAEFRNMTKAADYLFLTQPALSLRIQRLETELGIQIFDRTTRPLSITPEGQIYIQGMNHIRNEQEKLRHKLNEIKGKKNDTITIGIGFNRGRYWLPDLLPYLLREYPQTDYQFWEATDQKIEQLLKNGEIDYGITGSFTVVDGLSSAVIGTEQIYIGVPTSNPILNNAGELSQYTLQNPYCIDIKDLSGQTFIIGQTSYGLTRYMNMIFSMFNIVPGKIINIGNGETSYQLAARGIGITFMFSSYIVSSISNEGSRPVPCVLRDIPLQRTAFLLFKQAYSGSEKTNQLVDILQKAHSYFSWNTEYL